MAGNTISESVEYTHFFDQSMNHLGGQETRNGETINYEANWTQGAKSKSLSGNEKALTADDGVAFDVFGSGLVYVEEARTGWNGFPEVETTYYNSSGVEVGRSFKMTNEFQNFDGTTVTSTDVHYEAADGTHLGNEFSNNNSSGFRIEKLVSVTEEPAWLDFDDDGTDGESSITAIEMIFEKGSDSWSFTQNGVSKTNTRTFEHYFNKDTREHLGGKEVQDGVTMKFGPNWTELGLRKMHQPYRIYPR